MIDPHYGGREAVRLFIDAVALTLRQETGADGVLPVVHPKNTF